MPGKKHDVEKTEIKVDRGREGNRPYHDIGVNSICASERAAAGVVMMAQRGYRYP